ncbi:MAG TPA: DMT family transporter [Burkholderiaceae bacterium]|nr:DMT family transporter [Burkholderiaceae bacterium]
MTLQVTLAVLGAALLHAAWNAFIKVGRDPLLETTLIHAWVAVPALLLVPYVDLPGSVAALCLAASVTIHCLYYFALAAAYRNSDLSFSYPIMRGTAPMFTALTAGVVLREWPPLAGWLGIAAISGGVLTIGLARGLAVTSGAGTSSRADAARGSVASVSHNQRGKAVGWALLTASTIVAYTVVDSIGVRSAPTAWSYVVWLALLEGVAVFALVWALRGRSLVAYARARGVAPLGVGIAAWAAYGIALWAMTQAPVALVAALRETSVLFAMLIGALLLKERAGPLRWAGAVSIVAGIFALRLA